MASSEETGIKMDTVVEAGKGSNSLRKKPVILTEFTVFPKLPAEIRRLVWNFTFVPQVIRVWIPRPRQPLIVFEHNIRFPEILHVCKEARYEALNMYTPVRIKFPSGYQYHFYVGKFDMLHMPLHSVDVRADHDLKTSAMFQLTALLYGDMHALQSPLSSLTSSDLAKVVRKFAIDDYETPEILKMDFMPIDDPAFAMLIAHSFKFEQLEELTIIMTFNIGETYGTPENYNMPVSRKIYSGKHVKAMDVESEEFIVKSTKKELERAQSIRKLYQKMMTRERAKRAPGWKEPKLIVKRLAYVKNREEEEVSKMLSGIDLGSAEQTGS